MVSLGAVGTNFKNVSTSRSWYTRKIKVYGGKILGIADKANLGAREKSGPYTALN